MFEYTLIYNMSFYDYEYLGNHYSLCTSKMYQRMR